jgi:uncharacterized membrane protein (UPF0136 family)
MTKSGLAVVLTGVYGLVALIGGTIGYLKAGSLASLIAGGGSGVLLIVCALVARQKPKPGLIAAIVVSVLLVGRFVSASAAAGAVAPVALTMILGGVAVIVSSALALREQK